MNMCKQYKLIKPDSETVGRFNKFWDGVENIQEAEVSIFEGEKPISINGYLPEDYKDYKANDDTIKELLKTDLTKALKVINKCYHTRLRITDALERDTSWWYRSDNEIKVRDGSFKHFIKLCKKETGKWAYSYATKVYNFINPKEYPIIDSYAVTILNEYMKSVSNNIPRANWGNYEAYRETYREFVQKNGLQKFTYKQIDIFLWTYAYIIKCYWKSIGMLQFETVSYKEALEEIRLDEQI